MEIEVDPMEHAMNPNGHKKDEIELQRCKTLPIVIQGGFGQEIVVKGIKTIFNGQEAILMVDEKGREKKMRKKRKRQIPVAPVQPDIVLPMVDNNTSTALQSEL